MTVRIAINGYGRIGRNILRAFYENKYKSNIKIVAINDLGNLQTNAYLTKYDTTHGKFLGSVSTEKNNLIINGDKIYFSNINNPNKLPWKKYNIDIVMECTGYFTKKENAISHIISGANKVLISSPSEDNIDSTIVYGVNNNVLKNNHLIISNSSCTTNCLAVIIKPINDTIGLKYGLMTTIHSYTNDQVLTDIHHKDFRRARSAANNQIPTKTGAASNLWKIFPELKNKLDGYAIRVPTLNVSIVDLVFIAKRQTSKKEINSIMKKASKENLKGILKYNEEKLVSKDFNHDSHSAIFDSTLTKVINNLVKIYSWYDNEWAFSNRMLDVAILLSNLK